jgi:hypothetical protein
MRCGRRANCCGYPGHIGSRGPDVGQFNYPKCEVMVGGGDDVGRWHQELPLFVLAPKQAIVPAGRPPGLLALSAQTLVDCQV